MSTLNINVGVLGHVDSGKTSLSKAMSRVGSTAAFDKNPQSQARGITLDLGFCAFDADVADDTVFKKAGVNRVQFTLVDCPGHASLIRTVLGGAQIIDVMILVVDVTKGIQTQTAECIVVGEILNRRLVVVLNKVDAVQGNTPEDRAAALAKNKKKLRGVFGKTRWPNAPFFDTAANPGAGKEEDGTAAEPIGVDALRAYLLDIARRDQDRINDAPAAKVPRPLGKDLLMLVDHCFAIKGQGTVLTGTLLQGLVKVGDDVLLPDHQLERKVKGIQMFRKPVQTAQKGDRIGLCVTQFNAGDMERGIVCAASGAGVMSVKTVIARVHKVRFHKIDVEPGLKYHVTIGHSTVMGTMRFFARSTPDTPVVNADGTPGFDFAAAYDCVENLPEASEAKFGAADAAAAAEAQLPIAAAPVEYYAVLQLEHAVTTFPGSSLIASRLDSDIHASSCRIAVHGQILTPDVRKEMFPASYPVEDESWRMLRVVKHKEKEIAVDRILDDRSCISRSITAGSQNQDVTRFIGAKITLKQFAPKADPGAPPQRTVQGVIDSAFGKSGKTKLRFSEPVFTPPAGKGEGGSSGDAAAAGPKGKVTIVLAYTKNPFATVHRFTQ